MFKAPGTKNENVICQDCGIEIMRRNLKRHYNRAHNYRDMEQCSICSRPMYKESINSHLDLCKKRRTEEENEKNKPDKSSLQLSNHIIPSLCKSMPNYEKKELQYIKSRKDFDRMVDAASLYLKQKNSCNLKLKSNSKIDTCSSDDNSDIDIDVENCAEENLNVIKEEKNKEECETQEPSQVILRECKDEIYSGSEKIKVWTKTEELEFMEAKADRKKFDDEMQILELEIENNRKEEELDNLFEKENEVYRDKLEKELTISQIKDWFRKNINYLKDIWSGKIQSDRHDIYIAGGRPARDLIFYTILDPFTVDQQDCAFREMEKVWMKTKEEKRENWEYIEKVLLSEFLIKLYGDFFGIHKRQEYEVHNSNCPITLLTK